MAKKIYTAEENAVLLTAWNHWKEVCWIRGLGQSREEGVVGTPEEADRLAKLVHSAFKRKLNPYLHLLGDEKSFYGEFAEVDTAMVFDLALFEYEKSTRYVRGHWGEEGFERKKKAWKNSVWKLISESNDPPLKIIHGKLLGPDGVINQVVEDWLMTTYSCRMVKDSQSGRVLHFHQSLDGKDDNGRQTDIPDAEVFAGELGLKMGRKDGFVEMEFQAQEDGEISPPLSAWDDEEVEKTMNEVPQEQVEALPSSWRNQLIKLLTPRLLCVLCASLHNVKIEDEPAVLRALGVSRSSVQKDFYERLPQLIKKMDVEFQESLRFDELTRRALKMWLKNKIKLEMAGRLLLSCIRALEKCADSERV